jgi:chromosome segregation ATPase
MKNLHQNLLITLALCLCGLCAWQWYEQTLQRNRIEELNGIVNGKSASIQEYTNTIQNMQHQLAQMDAGLTTLKDTVKTNQQTIVAQRHELNRLDDENAALTNVVQQYQQAVDSLTNRLKDAYDGIARQDTAISNLVAERNEWVKKYNAEVVDRNNVVSNYNDLAAKFEKLQAGGK